MKEQNDFLSARIADKFMKEQNGIFSDRIADEIIAMQPYSREELCDRSRHGTVSESRFLAMYLIRHNTSLTLERIGKLFNRDHASVLYGISKVEDFMSYDKSFRKRVASAQEELNYRKNKLSVTQAEKMKTIGNKVIMLLSRLHESERNAVITSVHEYYLKH